MIVIDSQKLTIPEEERFVGFFGDDRYTTKSFLVKSGYEDDNVYTLYLTFDNNKTTEIVLLSTAQSGQGTLIWNVQDDHILKSGLIKAQIKVKNSDGGVFFTESDYFYAGKSLPFEGDISDSGYTDIYDLEDKVAEIINDRFDSVCDEFVPVKRRVAGLSLKENIEAQALRDSLNVYPVMISNGPPTTSITNAYEGQLLYSQNEQCLYRCYRRDETNGISTYWEEIYATPKHKIAGLSLQTDITVAQLQTALGIGNIETTLDKIIAIQENLIGGATE